DQPAAQIVFDDAVDDGSGEPRIFRRRNPRRQLIADVLIEHFGLGRPVEVLRHDRLFRPGIDDLAFEPHVELAFVVLISILLYAHAGEERGKAPEIILRPFFPGVIVALSALQPYAQEHLADIGGVTLRLGNLLGPPEVRYGLLVEVAGGG